MRADRTRLTAITSCSDASTLAAGLNRQLELIERALDAGDLDGARHRVRALRRAAGAATARDRTSPKLAGGVALTCREAAVIQLLPDGSLRQQDMARMLGVTRNTLKTHLKALYLKLGAHSRAEAIGRARELGLLARPVVSATSSGPNGLVEVA